MRFPFSYIGPERQTIDINILPTGEIYVDRRHTSESCEFVWHLGSGRWLA